MVERTLSIIKPDAVSRGLVGEIIKRYEEAGFRILVMKRMHLSQQQAKAFYEVHRHRPFFESLTTFMASGPVVVMVLEGEGVIKRHRDLMGATDPREAGRGTLRGDLGIDIERNVLHGSDSQEAASFEIAYFFTDHELLESPAQ